MAAVIHSAMHSLHLTILGAVADVDDPDEVRTAPLLETTTRAESISATMGREALARYGYAATSAMIAGAVFMLGEQPVLAQAAPEDTAESSMDIVVTARKQSEKLQKV